MSWRSRINKVTRSFTPDEQAGPGQVHDTLTDTSLHSFSSLFYLIKFVFTSSDR